ncbi:acyl-CoA thioesterase [Paludisphaera soli]|uniref:acyl-CoA thioesterase n=1 Tax=Paludisphaera soli TaxID=2712865 RepID=UPI0013ED0210|nr:acyl-CoA thioesterase [Paludisphaera soli]
MRAYEYRHIVGFEETNLVGNVYFVNHLRWQGRCRELFLRDHAPGTLAQMSRGLAFVTVRVVCDYLEELRALDEVSIRMTLESLAQNRLTMSFEYFRTDSGREKLVARGEQQIACMLREGDRMTPIPIPSELRDALRSFSPPPSYMG